MGHGITRQVLAPSIDIIIVQDEFHIKIIRQKWNDAEKKDYNLGARPRLAPSPGALACVATSPMTSPTT